MENENVLEFFHALLDSAEEKKIVKLLMEEKNEEEILEALIGYNSGDKND